MKCRVGCPDGFHVEVVRLAAIKKKKAAKKDVTVPVSFPSKGSRHLLLSPYQLRRNQNEPEHLPYRSSAYRHPAVSVLSFTAKTGTDSILVGPFRFIKLCTMSGVSAQRTNYIHRRSHPSLCGIQSGPHKNSADLGNRSAFLAFIPKMRGCLSISRGLFRGRFRRTNPIPRRIYVKMARLVPRDAGSFRRSLEINAHAAFIFLFPLRLIPAKRSKTCYTAPTEQHSRFFSKFQLSSFCPAATAHNDLSF